MSKSLRVTDLTVDQFQELIRQTVQETVAEVMLEFLLTAQMESELALDAELADSIRASMSQSHLPIDRTPAKVDD